MPPATVTSWPVTWPESTSEASTTTCAATSSGWATFSQRHRPRHPAQRLLVERAARHRRFRPAGAHCVHARARRDPDDLVLQAQQEPVGDRRLRGGVVRVAGLAEEARGRGDQHQRPVAPLRHPAQEAARGQEGRRQVRAQRLLPALERQLPDRHVLRRPDAGDRSAHVQRPRLPRTAGRPPPPRAGRRRPTAAAPSASARSRPRW